MPKYIVSLEVFDENRKAWVPYDISVEAEDEDEAEGQAIVEAKSGDYGPVADDGVRVNSVEEENATVYCGTGACEFEATEMHPVSFNADEVHSRPFCYTCTLAYESGAQHGEMRAIRDLVRGGLIEAANFLNKVPLTAEEIERIKAIGPLAEYGGDDI